LILPYTLCPGIENLHAVYHFNTPFFNLLGEIDTLTQAVGTGTVSSMDSEPTAVHIRYRLLSWIDPSSAEEQSSVIQQSILFGAVIHIKTLLPEPPVRGIDYTVMISNLKRYLLRVDICSGIALVVWLLFIGGCAADNHDRAWFSARLLSVIDQRGINKWKDVKKILLNFWWVESLHEEPRRQLWEEVMAMCPRPLAFDDVDLA